VGELRGADLTGYAEAWRERARQDSRARDARRTQALAVAGRLAHILVEEHGARDVYLFGSTATGRHYRLDSDIDLAVSGIAPERQIRVDAEVTLMATPGFGADLLFLEDAPEIFRDRVRKEGIRLGQTR